MTYEAKPGLLEYVFATNSGALAGPVEEREGGKKAWEEVGGGEESACNTRTAQAGGSARSEIGDVRNDTRSEDNLPNLSDNLTILLLRTVKRLSYKKNKGSSGSSRNQSDVR